MAKLRQRLAEQNGRHQGGSKWIGTAGTSPFGAYGDNPEGVRMGQDKRPAGQRRQDLGQARIQGLRRRRRARAAQHPLGAEPPAPLRARGRGRGARSRRHHPLDRRQGLYRRQAAARSAATRSRCCCSSTSAARWIGTSRRPRRCSRRRGCNSSGSSISTSTIASTRACGRTTAAASRNARRRGTCSIPIGRDHRVVFVGDASMSPHEILRPAARSSTTTPSPARPG